MWTHFGLSLLDGLVQSTWVSLVWIGVVQGRRPVVFVVREISLRKEKRLERTRRCIPATFLENAASPTRTLTQNTNREPLLGVVGGPLPAERLFYFQMFLCVAAVLQTFHLAVARLPVGRATRR